MKKWWRGRKKYIDENELRVQREAAEELPFLIEYGEEADVLEKAKIWNPDITPEELQELSNAYRAAKLARVRGR